MKTRIRSIIIVLTLLFLGLSPQLQAVSPAPDGCYPGFTTAEGCKALNFLTTGAGNTGVGWYSLYVDTTGSYNTGLGAGALALNNADSNTAVGTAAMLLNTAGHNNTAVGTDALVYNDTGSFNTAIGDRTLFNNTTGGNNVAVGVAGCCGPALLSNTTGGFNTAIGGGALSSNTEGNDNTAIGGGALADNIDGDENVAVGINALGNNTGNNNVALGNLAGFSHTSGDNNIYIGTQIDHAGDESNACYIGSIFGQTASVGVPVLISSGNKLGTLTSSKRFKEDIKAIGKASEALFSLEPVTFHYKKEIDPVGKSQFGLVAEDVEKVNPDLIVRDKEGKPYSVRYDQVNAMLLNEFLKEHRAVQELKNEIAALTATVKEQAAQIEKVSAQLEVSKPTTKVVVNK